jgi:hypothetical protein
VMLISIAPQEQHGLGQQSVPNLRPLMNLVLKIINVV